jgi:hypothetical protein
LSGKLKVHEPHLMKEGKPGELHLGLIDIFKLHFS